MLKKLASAPPMLSDKLDRLLLISMLILCLPPLVSAVYPGYNVNSFQISEWLINYQGGFVRRGLPGELILALSRQGLNPYFVIIGMSFSIWLILIVVLLKLSANRGFPKLIILSQLCMLSPVIAHQVVRKDCLEILLFIVSLSLIQKEGVKAALFANVVSVLAMLSHEVYAFISIPLFALVKYTEQDQLSCGRASTREIIKRSAYAATFISPILTAFIICIIYKGSPAIAEQVWDSWHNTFPEVAERAKWSTPNAIEGLGWSVAKPMQGPLSLFGDFSYGIYVPFAWAVTAALVALYLLFFFRSHLKTLQAPGSDAEAAVANFARIISIQLIAILPVCVVHWDYGRVIFSWAASSIGAFLVLTPARQLAISSLVSNITYLLPRAIRTAFGIVGYAYDHLLSCAFGLQTRIVLTKLSLLIFGIPTAWWSVEQYVAYVPLIQPFYYAINAAESGWGPPKRIASYRGISDAPTLASSTSSLVANCCKSQPYVKRFQASIEPTLSE